MPLYKLIFLIECNCMYEKTLETVRENGYYYLSEECLYLRMFGGYKAPSLLPMYATEYVVHKEVVRQLYIDWVRKFLLI